MPKGPGSLPTGCGAKAGVLIALPHPALRSYVTFHYIVHAFEPLVDFLYPEWGNVRFSIRGDWRVHNDPRDPDAPSRRTLFGPTDRCGRVETEGGVTIGFGLTPLGWDRLIGSDAAAMANRARELQGELLTDEAALHADLIAQAERPDAVWAALDEALLQLVAARPPCDEQVLATDRVLRSRPRDVRTFAAEVGVSSRSLQRICLWSFGFAPKRLLRRQRFLETLGVIRVNREGEIGSMLGERYYDHSHFNRDFRDFMGMTARTYAHSPRALMQAAAAAQVAAGVTLSFELPEPPQP